MCQHVMIQFVSMTMTNCLPPNLILFTLHFLYYLFWLKDSHFNFNIAKVTSNNNNNCNIKHPSEVKELVKRKGHAIEKRT